jgi:glycosyltransferase involved in cell wall biosynthesis
MRGLIVITKGEFFSHKRYGSFFIVARDLSRILDMRVMGLEKTVYPYIAMTRPDLVISIGTLNTNIFLTKIAALIMAARRVIAYGVIEGSARKFKPVSDLVNMATRLNKLCIVVPSNYVKTEMQRLGVNVKYVIPHGVDLEIINSLGKDKIDLPAPDRDVKVLSVFSDLHQARKSMGLYYLLRAWSQLHSSVKRKANLILKVPGGTRQFVNKIASSAGLAKEDYTILDNWLSRDSLYSLFKSSSVYVHGTLADAFGLPLVESIACGTPVIALNAPPWNEIVDEKIGWLVDVEREIMMSRGSLLPYTHRLRIPNLKSLSSQIESAVEFCADGHCDFLRKNCLERARMFDIKYTYKKFKDII